MRAQLVLLGLISTLVLSVGGCAATQNAVEAVKVDADPNSPVRKNAEVAGARVGNAVSAPLHDVNLIRNKIPPILLDAVDAPYARPKPFNCSGIKTALDPLEPVLSPDLDQPKPEETKTAHNQKVAGDATIDAIKGAAEGVIPFRAWVRMLSGAEREDKQVRAAILAGEVRRAYLKGLGLTRRCQPPAAPLQTALDATPKPRPVKQAETAVKETAPKNP